MNITPVRNIFFCKNINKPNSTMQKAKDIISKQDGIDLFLDAYGVLINKIKETEENCKKLEESISKTDTNQQKDILSAKIKLAKKELSGLQKNKAQMEKVIYIIDSLANSDNPIEIEFIDRSNEE